MANRNLTKLLTSLAGEFLVAGQLCMRGYVASLTLKNYPDVDIFVLDPDTQEQFAVQVKSIFLKPRRLRGNTGAATYPEGAYFIPEKVDRLENTWFVFVTIDAERNVEYYVVPSEDVARISEDERRRYLEYARGMGRVVSDDQPRMISLESLKPFCAAWDTLPRKSQEEVSR